MQDFFFYLFSAVTLGGAIFVVTSKNAVNAAVFLIVSFLGVASMFVLLEAYFLAVIQVLVYAGAVVVLFLFIIMLLDVQADSRRKFKPMTALVSLVALVLLILGAMALYHAAGLEPSAVTGPGVGASLKGFGYALFTTYLLPMQVTGFLLLVAMIGVIVLSKRLEPPRTDGAEADTGKATS